MCARADQRDTINLTVDVAKKKQILVPGAWPVHSSPRTQFKIDVAA